MFEWIRGLRKKSAPVRRLRSRGEETGAERVEVAEFAPKILPFLGMTAYLELELYEAATRAVSGAPTLQAKDVLARVAGETLSKHQRLTAEIRRRDAEPHVVMEPHSAEIDAFFERVETADWHQHVLSLYLVGGLFDDFFASLAGGVKDAYRDQAIEILSEDAGRVELKQLLQATLEDNEGLSSWLALWGRRLVGDTLLVSRAALLNSDNRTFDQAEVEPVFTDLIADHIRRMDGLGLTA